MDTRNNGENSNEAMGKGTPREGEQPQEVYERTGSTDHNDYKISGKEEASGGKDESQSYVDYNGNSEANDPARAS